MDNICGSADGCNGRLCRNAKRLLGKMTVQRYPLSGGEPDLDQTPAVGWVCGFITRAKAKSGSAGRLCIAGRVDGEADAPRLTAVASSLGSLHIGDRITVGETVYRVWAVEGGSPCVARLITER